MNDVAFERERDAKAAPGSWSARPAMPLGSPTAAACSAPNCPPSPRPWPLGAYATVGVRADLDGRQLGSPRRCGSLGRFARCHRGAGAACHAAVTPACRVGVTPLSQT